MSRKDNIWQTRPLFVSSTFQDMHAERDWLWRKVFPRLKEKLRQLCCYLEPVDLRVGMESEAKTEEERELLILKVCLQEIDRCRPFMLVLLGDRYGWVPPADRLHSVTTEAAFEFETQNKSVTSLEVEYGIRRQADGEPCRILFYIRNPLPYAEMPREVAARYSDAFADDLQAAARAASLRSLKDRITDDPDLDQQFATTVRIGTLQNKL